MIIHIPRFAREPLWWFLLAGGALFLLDRAVTRTDQVLDVSRAVQASLVDDYQLLTGHAPDASTRQKLVDDYIGDDVLFRAALKQGLHLNDPQIRKRLVDRMRFLLAVAPPEPTEADLLAFYSDHSSLYRSEPATTFDDASGRRFTRYGDSMLRALYGQSFVAALGTLPLGQSSGPVPTSQGDVVIRVLQRFPAALLDYESIRDQVRADWLADRNEVPIRRAVDSMKRDYRIRIEP